MGQQNTFNAYYDKPWIIKSSVILLLCVWASVAFLIWILKGNAQISFIKLLFCIGAVIYMITVLVTRLFRITRKYPCLQADEKGLIYDCAPFYYREYFEWDNIRSMVFSDESSWKTVKVLAYSTKRKKTVEFTVPLNILIKSQEVYDILQSFWNCYGKGY